MKMTGGRADFIVVSRHQKYKADTQETVGQDGGEGWSVEEKEDRGREQNRASSVF